MAQVSRDGASFESEARLRRADGEYRWLLIRAVPLCDEKGNIVKWYGTSTDVEDRKQAEQIRAAQARHLALYGDVTASFCRRAPLNTTLNECVEAVVRQVDAAFARIWTLNKDQDMLELQASAGMYSHLNGARTVSRLVDNPKHRRSSLVRLTRKGDARYRELNARFLAIASTMGAGLTEPDIRRTTEIVRHLSSDVKARSERLS